MNVNMTLKGLLYFGLFAVLFIPFIVANNQFFPFITGKAFVFRIAVEILFAIWIILFIRDRSFLPKFSWITGAVLIFVGVIAIADLFGENPYKSFWSNYERMEGLISLIHLLLYFLVVSSVLKTEKLWKKFFNVSVAASVIMAIFSFFQLAGKITINQGGVRVDGTFGNATYLAVYMLINMFLAAYLFARARENIYLRIGYVAAFIMQGVVLYHTATRGAILGLIGGAALTGLLILIFTKGEGAKKMRITGAGILISVALTVGGFFALRNSDFVKNSLTLGRFASLSTNEIRSQGRYYVWPMALAGFKERPILGWGQENFSFVFNENYNPKMWSQEPWFDRTHNIFLDWLIAGGALGFLAYLGLYAALIFYIWRGKNNFSVTDKSILVGLIGAYVFQNIFVFDNLISYIMFFSILAYVHALSADVREPIGFVSRITANQTKAERIALSALLVALIFSLYFWNAKPILANRALIRALDVGRSTAEQSVENFKKVFEYDTFGSTETRDQLFAALTKFSAGNVAPATRNAFITLAKEELARGVDFNPKDTRSLLFAGSFFTQIGEHQKAISYFERALATSPQKQNVIFGLGSAYLAIGPSEYKTALEIFKKAYDLDPNYPEARLIYALGAIYNKDDRLAGELLSTLEPSRALFDDRILFAYLTIGRINDVVSILELRVNTQPQNAGLRTQLAAGYFQRGEKNRAIAELRKAIELDPSSKEELEFIISEILAGRNPLQ